MFKLLAGIFVMISSYKFGFSKLKKFTWILLLAVIVFILNIHNLDLRVCINVMNYAIIASFISTSVLYLKKIDEKIIHSNLLRMTRLWKVLVLLALPQLALDLLGYTLSYEAIGEFAPENRGEILGYILLRPNSVFGEPRDLCAFALFALVGDRILRKKGVGMSYIIAVLIGLLTQSSTFFLVLGFVAAFHLFRRLGPYAYLMLPLISFGSIQFVHSISRVISRVPDITNFQLAQFTSLEFTEQAGDFSFFFYLGDWFLNFKTFLFGNGIGSSNRIIGEIVSEYFPLKEDFLIINSRWLFYNLLVDLGLISCMLLLVMIRKLYLKLDISFKHLFMLSLAFSLFTSNYFFIIILVLCLENSKREIAI